MPFLCPVQFGFNTSGICWQRIRGQLLLCTAENEGPVKATLLCVAVDHELAAVNGALTRKVGPMNYVQLRFHLSGLVNVASDLASFM